MRTATLSVLFAVAAAGATEPKFRVQEIERGLKVGYAVIAADVNGDGKPDLVVVDATRVVWYENPTWQRRTIIEAKTPADNVCIAAADIDGDGKVDFALGSGWKPFDTNADAPLNWLRRGKTLDEPWELFPIGAVPTLHRIRFANLTGAGKPDLIVAPLMGRGSTKASNWMDGRPVQLVRYPIPADPVKGPWVSEVISESLHVVHNFATEPTLATASYDGITVHTPAKGAWIHTRVSPGDQSTPAGSRGASEIAPYRSDRLTGFATVEPWHGNTIVFTRWADSKATRHVIDSRLRWGHAVAVAALDGGDSVPDIVVGVRDNPAKGDATADPRGVRIYRNRDGDPATWDRTLIDPDGVAVEDLIAVDLDGDGRPEIVAAGRATGNVRIYWNLK